MAVKASLKIQLFANDVLVAESEDEQLWRKVLAAIQQGGESSELTGFDDEDIGGGGKATGARALADAIGATQVQVAGACDPTTVSPYLHLDAKCWEAFRKNTPDRGRGAISPSQMVATLLCLWFKHGNLEGRPTQAQTLEVLDGIGVKDGNASRSIKNCAWLQTRSDGLQINPAETSQAERVAIAFVTKNKLATDQG